MRPAIAWLCGAYQMAWLFAPDAITKYTGENMKIDEKTFKAMPAELQALFSKCPNPGSDEVKAAFPEAKGQQGDLKGHASTRQSPNGCFGKMAPAMDHLARVESDKSAARFFYCAKASKKDRNEGCEQIDAKQYSHDGRQTPIENAYQRNASRASNNHPTVKPTDLMRYLCRLVTPPNGIVLDPFMGSGSTGKAAMLEGFRFMGVELDQAYFDIAKQRIGSAQVTVYE